MVITTAQLHSTKPELRFCAGSNPARGVSEIRDGEDLWQWSLLEIRLNAFRRSTIPQKHSSKKIRHRYLPCKFLRFLYLFLDGGFQSFLSMQNLLQSWHKITNIAWIDIILMSFIQYLDTLLSTFMYLKSQKLSLGRVL